MLVSLDTPYADTTAADLSMALGDPQRPALHVLDARLADGIVARLCLLGASHQVLLDTPAGSWSETVACVSGRAPGLPGSLDDGPYRFAAGVERLDRAVLAARVAAVRDGLRADPHGLVGVFPGDEDAITALRVRLDPSGATASWQTWHAYPQTGELVQTETTVALQ